MQCISNCNYNINKLTNRLYKRKLFNFFLTRLPKENTLYAFNKKDLKFKRKAKTREAIKKGKFLFYNTNFITELIFDIDNISHLIVWDLDWIYKVFYEKFGLPITWSCKTDKGIQFCISLNTFFKLSKKQKQILKDFKQYIADNWELIDKAGSMRLEGWWRNPLTQTDFRYYENVLSFDNILDFLTRNKLTTKQQFKAEVRKEQIKQAKQSNKIRFTVGAPVVGNRNNFVWYNLMLASDSKDFNTLLQLARELNKKVEKELDDKEIEKIAKSVLRYNKEGKNFIYANSKKARWNIGSMGFEKISGLSKEEYEKEKKRRQSMAGKAKAEIGKKNLIKAVKARAEATKEKVYKAIKELQEKGERITVSKVVEVAGVGKNSANKYINLAREEGILTDKKQKKN